MKKISSKFEIFLILLLNVIGVTLIFAAVMHSVNQFDKSSYDQDVLNIKTLTGSSANKVDILLGTYKEQVLEVANYVSNDNNEDSMTKEEAFQFVSTYLPKTDNHWLLMNNYTSGTGSSEAVKGITLNESTMNSVSFLCQYYNSIETSFVKASEETLFNIGFINEFTYNIDKSFGIYCPVKIKEDSGYGYYNLFFVINSSNINSLLTQESGLDDYKEYGFTSAIVNSNGDYVLSTSAFQKTNFIDYLKAYNTKMNDEDEERIISILQTGNNGKTLLYKNNFGETCLFTISNTLDNGWNIVSCVPLDNFTASNGFMSSFLFFFLSVAYVLATNLIVIFISNLRLRKKSKEASDASEAKSEFLSSMSHDIRTPMNAIFGMTIIAKEALDKQNVDYSTIKDCINTIEVSSNSLLTLINDILDISKIETGKIVLSDEVFSITEIIDKMIGVNQYSIKDKKFNMSIHMENISHEFVKGDAIRINQIYTNILSNAIKYTREGGFIEIDFKEEDCPNDLLKRRFIFQVKDTGMGMSEEFQKHLFERFTRAVDTRINMIQGTGLGLSIVKQLVDLMNGQIDVESKLDVGSTFTITIDLPVSEVKTNDSSLKGVSCLVIDDDEAVLKSCKYSLNQLGVLSDISNGINDSIDKIIEFKAKYNKSYDVILLDWIIDSVSIENDFYKLKDVIDSHTKVIVMSAYNLIDIKKRCDKIGIDLLISKPVFPSKLSQNIKIALNMKTELIKEEDVRFNIKVLVAEDNDINWIVIEKVLNHLGAEVDRAKNGEEAISIVKNGNYQLVLMDIQMPVMNGYDSCIEIRKFNETIPIYAMTADVFSEDVGKAKDAGMNGHLGKPVDISALTRILYKYSLSTEKKKEE